MKFSISPLTYLGIGINASCLIFVAVVTINSRLNSQNSLTARQQSLQTIAQHYQADHCWEISSDDPFKLGDLVSVPGSFIGRIPTSCIKSLKTQQLLHVAYLNGQLVVSQIYTPTELRKQLSKLKESE